MSLAKYKNKSQRLYPADPHHADPSRVTARRAGCHALPKRQGAVLMAVVVCLFVIGLVGANLLTTLMSRERQMRIEQHRMQAFWLAESAIDRARARLRESPDYNGETWQPSLTRPVAGGALQAEATIRIQRRQAAPQLLVLVETKYPLSGPFQAGYRKQLWIELSSQGTTP